MVKVIHILTADISKMVTDRVIITIDIKYEVTYDLSIAVLDFLKFKVKAKHILTAIIAKMVTYRENISITVKSEVVYAPSASMFTFHLNTL